VVNLAVEKFIEIFKGLTVLYIGGGNFLIKVPLNIWDVGKYDSLSNEIYKSLLNTNLSLNISFVSNEHNLNYGKLVTELNNKTNAEKLKKYTEPFYFQSFTKVDHLSQNHFINLTEKLLNHTGYDIIEDTDITNEYPKNISFDSISLFGKKLKLSNSNNKLKTIVPKWNQKLKTETQEELINSNENDFDEPIKLNNVIGFEYLGFFSKIRTGTDKIAALKLDVDNLGLLFQKIESEELNSYLSTQFNIFFGKKLPTIIQDNDIYKNNLYVVFSGGDDTFIIGSWDIVIEFAYTFKKEFELFEKETRKTIIIQNPITFSASITIVDSHYPIVKLSELAEERLDKCKSVLDKDKLDATNSHMKNKIFFLNKIFTWEEFEKLRELKGYFYDMITKHKEKRTFLQKIQREFDSKDNIIWNLSGKPYHPSVLWRIKYHFRDIRKQKYFIENYENLFFGKTGIYEEEIINKFSQEYFHNQIVPAASRWAELLTRN